MFSAYSDIDKVLYRDFWYKNKTLSRLESLNTFIGPLQEKDLELRDRLNDYRNQRYIKQFCICVSVCAKLTAFDEVFGSWPRQARKQYKGLSQEEKYIKYLADYTAYQGKE